MWTLFSALTVMLLAACGGLSGNPASRASSTTTTAATGSPIRVGVLADVTGNFAPSGAEIHLGTDLAVQQINAAGGINGRRLELTYVDPKGDPAQAIQLATQLVQQDHVDALLGAVSSAECLGVENLVAKLGVAYITQTGCATDELTAKSCNKFTFRTQAVGVQQTEPFTAYLVKTYGTRWAIFYQDYAFGQSISQSYQSALTKAGGSLAVKIAIPLGETNFTPYVTKLPADGSIDGVIAPFGGSDQARIVSALQQFGLGKKLAIVTGGNRENFGGAWPDAINGTLYVGQHPTEALPGNALDQAFVRAFEDLARTSGETAIADLIGGPSKAAPGNSGYVAFTAVTALKQAMIASRFAGRADTEKLIAALENLNAPPSADFPAGGLIMSKTDHQARMPEYVFKINGQAEDLLQTIPADQLPPVGQCKVS